MKKHPRPKVRPTPVPRAVVPKHHALVRLTHWANVPLLFGLIASGLSIYWAAPVFTHAPDPVTGSRDYLVDLGLALARLLHEPAADPRRWVYDHFSLGTRHLAIALRLHWVLAYLFMLNGALYALGLFAGGGWRALLPRASDVGEALAMIRFYLGVVAAGDPAQAVAASARAFEVQRAPARARTSRCRSSARSSCCRAGRCTSRCSSAGSSALFVSYDGARIVHFVCMLVLGSFVVPHVVLVIARRVRTRSARWSSAGPRA